MSRADLLCAVAHPDDESFGLGSVLAAAAASGARVVVVCATRGEAGEDHERTDRSPQELGQVRERELRAAAAALGVAEVEVLDFADSGWDGPAPDGALVDGGEALVAAVQDALSRHRPRVVVTLDPAGSDGHRDHASIGHATTVAFERQDDPGAALYHWCLVRSLMDRWGVARGAAAGVYAVPRLGRPDEDITTVLDGTAVLATRRRAIAAHATQSSPFAGLPSGLEAAFLTEDHLIRITPPWAGGPVERRLTGFGPEE